MRRKHIILGGVALSILLAVGYVIISWKTPEETLGADLKVLEPSDTLKPSSETVEKDTQAASSILNIDSAQVSFPPVPPGANHEQDLDFFQWLQGTVSSISFEVVQQALLSDQPEHRKAAVLETYIEVFGGKGVRNDLLKWHRLIEYLLTKPNLISSDLTMELSMVLGLIAREMPQAREIYTREFLRTVNDPQAENRTVVLASGVWETRVLQNTASEERLGYRIQSASIRAITHCDDAIDGFIELLHNPNLNEMLQEDISRYALRAAKSPDDIDRLMTVINEIPDEKRRIKILDSLVSNISTAGFPGKSMFFLNHFRRDYIERAREEGECVKSHFNTFRAYHAYYLEEDATARANYQKAVLDIFETWLPKFGNSEMPECFWQILSNYAWTFERSCKSYHQYDRESNAFSKHCLEPDFERTVKTLREKYVKDESL